DVQQQDRRVTLGAVGEAAAAEQVVQGLHAVLDVHDRVGEVGVAKRVDRHLCIVRAVLGEEDGADGGHEVGFRLARSRLAGRVKWKVAPLPGSDLAQTRPLCLVTTRLTLARPMPVPLNSLGECSRWNTPNSL